MNSEELSKLVVEGMEEIKAEDIIMDLRKVKGSISDYFVICSGNSDTQLEAISESVEKIIKRKPKNQHGEKKVFRTKNGVLLDYVNVVVHIF